MPAIIIIPWYIIILQQLIKSLNLLEIINKEEEALPD
jgi:hypothetical protein